MSVRIRISLLWVAVLGVLFLGLSNGPLTDLDEGAFSEASREMLVRGDWISPWLLDAPRFDKPVLIHWLQMVSFSIFGTNTFAARLPSVLAAMIWIGAIGSLAFRVGRRLWPQREPLEVYFWAVVISATTIGLPAIGRAATADSLLNALLVLSLLCIWNFFFESTSRRWGRLAAICIGLGLLTKGPIAIMIPGMASVFAALGYGRFVTGSQSKTINRTRFYALWHLAWSRWIQLALDPMAWLIVITICGPWYLLQYQAQGTDFINGFFGTHNLGRFVSTMHGFSAGPWYYPAWILIATLPWLPLVIRSMIALRKTQLLFRGEAVMLWGIFLFVMVFFSFSATKLPHYGFYGLSGLIALMSLTVADYSSDSGNKKPAPQKFMPERIFMAAALICLVGLPFWWPLISPQINDAYYQVVWEISGEYFLSGKYWFAIPLFGAMVVLLTRPAFGLPVGALAFALTLHGFVIPTVMTALRGPITEAARVIKSMPAQDFITWRLTAPSLSFHAQRIIKPGDPKIGSTVVMHAKDHEGLQATLAKKGKTQIVVEQLWAAGGLQIVQIK